MGVKFVFNMDCVFFFVEIFWFFVYVVDEFNQLVEVFLNMQNYIFVSFKMDFSGLDIDFYWNNSVLGNFLFLSVRMVWDDVG